MLFLRKPCTECDKDNSLENAVAGGSDDIVKSGKEAFNSLRKRYSANKAVIRLPAKADEKKYKACGDYFC